MINLYACIKPLMMMLEPEPAHKLTLRLLKTGLAPTYDLDDPALKLNIWGREFKNPLGLAAGFDKDAEVIAPLLGMGFGFVEAGTVTPRPQEGNPLPRVFRDTPNRSVINRMGFPGAGLDAFVARVSDFRAQHATPKGLLGINIGMNKDAVSAFEDYRQGVMALAGMADYLVVNISSPNTPGLRDLQKEAALEQLIVGLIAARNSVDIPDVARPPLLIKVAPDLDGEQKKAIATLALRHQLEGLVVSNTTVDRPDRLTASLQREAGGLSGALLREKALQTLRDFYALTEGRIPLVGVGGISSAEEAWQRICAGASLVQIYTGLVYEGPALVRDILQGLSTRVAESGFATIADAVGCDMTGQCDLQKENSAA